MFGSWFKKIFKDIGIDLGTANTIIYVADRGYVINEPSYIAYNTDGSILSVGNQAKLMTGKVHAGIRVVRPLADGVISDFRAGKDMIRTFIHNVGLPRFLIYNAVIGVPSGITPVEQRAVLDSAISAGARHAFLIKEPMAAAIGLGLDPFGPQAHMIVDIGGGTTDIAVITYGGLIVDNTLRIAGDEMNEALTAYLKNHIKLHVGEQTVEHMKIEYGEVGQHDLKVEFSVRGLDHISRLPRKVTVSADLFNDALKNVLNSIVGAIRKALDNLPPELSSDLIDHGIILTGGGALLRGLDQYLRDAIGLPVTFPDNAMYCVAEGTRRILTDLKKYKSLLYT